MAAAQTEHLFFRGIGFIQNFKLRQTTHLEGADAVSNLSQSQKANGGQALASTNALAQAMDR